MIGLIAILFLLFAFIGQAFWPVPDPHEKEWTDKALGIRKKYSNIKK